MPVILLVPGWGYPSIWWGTACGGVGIPWSWGYTENPTRMLPEGELTIVVHSFGLYMLPEMLFQSATCIVWYGGFCAPPRHAKETQRALEQDTFFVMKKFYTRMFFPDQCPPFPAIGNNELLLADADRIVRTDYRAFWKNHQGLLPKITSVFGACDRIVRPPQHPACTKRKNLIILPGEGHMPSPCNNQWTQCLSRLLD